MTIDEIYMHRCLHLASLGAGNVAPNPMVGAVLVYDNRIIGEGYHKHYGQAHAEVNCINAVEHKDIPFIALSALYVSLEPCAHHGKTPPCADLIIEKKIKKVIVGCRDPFVQVDGKGIEKLQRAGIEVTTGILEQECLKLNKRFLTFHTKQRPYIILKWAQTTNSKIASTTDERLYITNEFTNRLVHKWRSEEMGIMVGTNTALLDDPELTNRLWTGKSPVRLVVDMNLRLPQSSKIFNRQQPTILLNLHLDKEENNLQYCQVTKDENIAARILDICFEKNIQSIIIEGGAKLLQTFIDAGFWDEARVITNTELYLENGLDAPQLAAYKLSHSENVFTDRIDYFFPLIS